MAQPTPYTPVHTFVSDSATLANFPGQQLDVEFNDIKATTDQIRANLALIQRDDGQPANGIVTYDTLAPALQTNGLATAAAWVSGTNYTVGTTVYQNYTLYRCLIAHTAGVFATDLAAAKWLLLTALPIGPQGIQGNIGPQGIQGNIGPQGAGYGGTSTTSLLIANSVTKVFTTQAGLAYLVGDYVRAKSAANGANYMEGLVSAYSGTSLSLAVTAIGGTGTFADWQLNQSGAPGAPSGVTSLNGQTGALAFPTQPGGRLTITSGVAVMVSDQTAMTALYYAPSVSPYIPLYDGTNVTPRLFTASNTDAVGLTLTLGSNWAANTLFDVFVTLKSNVVTLVTGPAWSVSTAGSGSRGYSLGTFAGLQTNAALMTVRDTNASTFSMAANQGTYVGTILTNGSAGQIDFKFGGLAAGGSAGLAGIWNMYNRTPGAFNVFDSTSQWGVSSPSTWQPMNGSTTQRVSFVTGIGDDAVDGDIICAVNWIATAQLAYLGLGLNSTTAPWSKCSVGRSIGIGTGNVVELTAKAKGTVPVGLNYLQGLQFSDSNSVPFQASSGSPQTQGINVTWWW